jgi:hypothetical protein
MEVKEQCHVKISKRSTVLENLDESVDIKQDLWKY